MSPCEPPVARGKKIVASGRMICEPSTEMGMPPTVTWVGVANGTVVPPTITSDGSIVNVIPSATTVCTEPVAAGRGIVGVRQNDL